MPTAGCTMALLQPPPLSSSYSAAATARQPQLHPSLGGAHDKPRKFAAAATTCSKHLTSTTPEGARDRTTRTGLVGSRRSSVPVHRSQPRSAFGVWSCWSIFPWREPRFEHRGHDRPSRLAMLAGRESARVRCSTYTPLCAADDFCQRLTKPRNSNSVDSLSLL